MKEIKIHLEEDHINKLTTQAQQQNISRSDLIRQKLKSQGYDRTSYARAVEAAARTIPGIPRVQLEHMVSKVITTLATPS
jgi:hypothetical protein